MSAPPTLPSLEPSGAGAADTLTRAWLQMFVDLPVLPDVPPIAEWVRTQAIPIGSENTTFQGQAYDFDRFPVITRLLTAFFEDPAARELFILKPVQTTFTTTVIFCVGWHLLFKGGNVIIALHVRDAARDKAKDEITPKLLAIPALGLAEEENETESTVATLRFPFGNVKVGSGGTKATLTGDPAALVILDECELHPEIDGAHSIHRARERLTGALHGGKLIAGSKPERECVIERDDQTRKWKLRRQDGTHLDAAYCSGSQLRYECLCPHCGGYFVPRFAHLRYDHCRDAPLPGLPKDAHPPLDLDRVKKETYWQCPAPSCGGRVHEGPEKVAWVMGGRWQRTPTAERRAKELFALPPSDRWSAQFGALTDIAFESLRWGNIAVKFIEAQGDPAALRAFRNGILGEPEPPATSENTTLAQVRRLIARPRSATPDRPLPSFYLPPWRWRDDDGQPTRHIPALSSMVRHIAIAIDTQRYTFKWSVKAHLRDGTQPLLEYGQWPYSKEAPELRHHLETARYYPLDHETAGSAAISTGLIDPKGDYWEDILELTVRHPMLTACAGEGNRSVSSKRSGPLWPFDARLKARTGIIPMYFHANGHWESRLYEDCIQKFDRDRYRSWAPALWLPTDVTDDYLEEHTTSFKALKNGSWLWDRTGPNDWGDCSKLHLIIDWVERLLPLQQKQARAAAKPSSSHNPSGKSPAPGTGAGAGKPKPRPRALTVDV